MADAYGTFTINFSQDFKGDKQAICDLLNDLTFNNDGSEFQVINDDILCLDYSQIQYPTVYPLIASWVRVNVGEDKWEEMSWDNYTDKYGDNEYEVLEREERSLEKVAQAFAQHIDAGEMNIACVSNEKVRYVNAEWMTVRHDGTGKRTQMYNAGIKNYGSLTISEETC